MKIITVKEAAELLHSDKRTIQRRACAGFYPKDVCGKHGRYWLFNEEKLINFVFSACT